MLSSFSYLSPFPFHRTTLRDSSSVSSMSPFNSVKFVGFSWHMSYSTLAKHFRCLMTPPLAQLGIFFPFQMHNLLPKSKTRISGLTWQFKQQHPSISPSALNHHLQTCKPCLSWSGNSQRLVLVGMTSIADYRSMILLTLFCPYEKFKFRLLYQLS